MSAKDELVVREKSKRSKTPTVTLSASAATVDFGGNTTLNWSSTNATSCSASGDWSGSRPVAGTATISDIRANQTYTLSCSGKKGSASQSVSVTIAAPTVSASLSQAKALVNESVTLQWQSTGATACSVAGGASATVGPSGSQVVSFASPGDRSFTVTCTNQVASASATTQLGVLESTTYSVPTDLSKVSYPEGYMVPTARIADVTSDPCNLDVSAVTYPQVWMGGRQLPQIKGAPLPPSVGRGMKVKDIMLTDNPAFVLPGAPGAPNGCKGDLRAEFVKLISRLKMLGVDTVEIPQWHWTSKRADGSWYWVRAEDSFGPLRDADLAYFTTKAHEAGLKVLVRNASLGMVDNPVGDGAAYVPPPTPENLRKWFDAYQAFVTERAEYFQSIGIDIWEVSCSTCMYHDDGDGSEASRVLTGNEYAKALATIKSKFTGKLFASYAPWLSTRPDILRQLDFVMTGIWYKSLSASEDRGLTVDSFKAALEASGAVGSLRYLDSLGIPVIVQIDWVQSRSNLLTLPGYMEETSCTSSIGNLNPSASTCIQREFQPDFALQAIVFEAVLEVIAANPIRAGMTVLAGEYWVTDPLMPQTAYPNLAASPRNKPAESILRAWYAR